MFMVIVHVLGTIVAGLSFHLIISALSTWQSKRLQKAVAEEISIALGVDLDSLDNDENVPKVISFVSARFSSELFRNRLSDLCGWLEFGWSFLGALLSFGVLIGVIWYSITDGPSNAVHAWWVVGIDLFFWVSTTMFRFACKLITGRTPGQASQVRESLAVLLHSRSRRL